MTIEQINKISQLLNSKDRELQDIGLIMCGRDVNLIDMPAYRALQLSNSKNELCQQAYLLGKLKGLKLLENGGEYTENQPDASIQ